MYQTILLNIAMTALVVAIVGLICIFFWLVIREAMETK
jgi:hypothetical protein